jgi:hypothetical protein
MKRWAQGTFFVIAATGIHQNDVAIGFDNKRMEAHLKPTIRIQLPPWQLT